MATKMRRDAKGRFVGKARANPKRTRKKSRRAKSQPRDRYGRFVPKGRARSNPGRYASNPVQDPVGALMSGGMAAVQLTIGKAATRAIPPLFKLPEGGNVGLAVQAATAVGLGWAASEFMTEELGAYLLVGGLQGVVEDLAVGYDVPFLAGALRRAPGIVPAPATGGGGVGRYVHAPTRSRIPAPSGVGRYPHATTMYGQN